MSGVVETIIPSASSFAAAGLAAWLAVRGVRHQTSTQHELAAGTQAAQRESEARAARREAYAKFISAAVRTAGLLVRVSEAGITEDEYRERREGAQQALHEVIEHEAIVSVEGPAGVAHAAVQARLSLDHELAVILAHRQARGSWEAVEQAGSARLEAVGRMTTAARRVFNGESTFAAPAPCRVG